ncbi:peptide ABC transporter permease [Aliidongia dinghuensis]|uniref:Peptide ABC transporter permease n=1 Tax=Aliidongia dinghuensis TaxID=1867774 RepID=A0A8J3E2N4_9PROT|nr:ABC transporter permease [Aliidongia dinghuensis]GGF12425.1 peptide ABC transporter permease [Aliidongia dinghuensis]
MKAGRILAALARPTVLVGVVLVGIWIVCALFAGVLAPYDPLQSQMPLVPPGGAAPDGHRFWLGTDLLGRDILSRLIYGARTVVIWAGLATATAYIVGIAGGLVAGYYRGRVDAALSFLANVVLSFPVLVLYILIIVTLGASGANIVIAVTFASAPAIFRLVRALTIDISGRDFVAAAVTQGESAVRIMTVEILPNATGPLVVDACLRLGYTSITIGVLGFLGLGLPPPTPDWGGMVNDGRAMAIAFPHLVIFPCIAISSLMLGLSLLADGLREFSRSAPRGGEAAEAKS